MWWVWLPGRCIVAINRDAPYGRRIRRERAAGDFSLQVAASSVLTRFVWHPRRQEQVASCVGFWDIEKVYQTTRSDEDGIRKAVNSCVSKDLTVLMTFDGFRALLADYLDLAYHVIYASSQAIYEDFCSGCRNPKVSHGARKRCVESASSRAWAKWIEDQTQSQESVPKLWMNN